MKRSLLTFILAGAVVLLLHMLNEYHVITLSITVLSVLRWISLVPLFIFGFQKKSLTGWIIIMLLTGFEFGYDFPDAGIQLKILSDIFLKLIKTIIAPLLFGTLVSGIAGHGNLRQVGRIGWKSILYFEIVTTFALAVGLIAINVSQPARAWHWHLPKVRKML